VVAGSNPVSPTHEQGLACDDAIFTKLNDSKLGTFCGPQVQRAVPRVRDGLRVGVQITLAREVAVTIRRTRPLPSSTLWRLVATLVGM
jgi:hypothetical protein